MRLLNSNSEMSRVPNRIPASSLVLQMILVSKDANIPIVEGIFCFFFKCGTKRLQELGDPVK